MKNTTESLGPFAGIMQQYEAGNAALRETTARLEAHVLDVSLYLNMITVCSVIAACPSNALADYSYSVHRVIAATYRLLVRCSITSVLAFVLVAHRSSWRVKSRRGSLTGRRRGPRRRSGA